MFNKRVQIGPFWFSINIIGKGCHDKHKAVCLALVFRVSEETLPFTLALVCPY